MTFPHEDRQRNPSGYSRLEASTVCVMVFPWFSHSANVNGFMVDPGWKPPAPFRSLPLVSLDCTLKFSWVSNFPRCGRNTVFCAMERIFPVPGWIETREAPHFVGFAPAVAFTWDCAAAWSRLSSVVVMVSPPRSSFCSRACLSAPYAGLLRNSWAT
jgi:hypothetical protein